MIETIARIFESGKTQAPGLESQAAKRLCIRFVALVSVLFVVGPVDSAERKEAQAIVESIVTQACFDCHREPTA